MTQPLDRKAQISNDQLSELDVENGEFWVDNPFKMPENGGNLSGYERNRLYLNAGNLDFVNASFASACDIDSDSRTAVAMDYDNDGDEDLLVGNVGGGPMRLFRNNLPVQNSIKIRLRGTESNRQGIGSRLTLSVGGKKIVRDLFPANGFMGSGPSELVIGLGQAESVDEISIRWPTGKSQAVETVKANTAIVITEGSKEVESKTIDGK